MTYTLYLQIESDDAEEFAPGSAETPLRCAVLCEDPRKKHVVADFRRALKILREGGFDSLIELDS